MGVHHGGAGCMPSFLVDSDDVAESGLVLRGEEVHHLRVRRCKAGDLIEVIDGQGGYYTARLETIDRDRAAAAILSQVRNKGEARVDLEVACALIKGDRFDTAVEKCTEVGVRSIQPLRCTRSIARDASEAKLDRWRRIAEAAAKQSGRSRVPVVHEPVDFDAEVAQPRSRDHLRLMAVAKATAPPLSEALDRVPGVDGVTLFIGPEGGFAPEEEEGATAAGIQSFAWGGDRALRADTAAVVLSALVLHQLGGYSSDTAQTDQGRRQCHES